MKTRLTVTLLALILPVGGARADARIEYRHVEGQGAALSQMLIGQGRLRVDIDGSTSAIFDPGTGTLIAIDHAERSYTRMGQAEIQQLSTGLGQAMAQFEAAMADLPPEMRAQMAGMLGGMLPGAGGEPMVRVSDTGRNERVAGHACRVFETRVQGQLVGESCLGSLDALDGLSRADRRTLEQVMAMSEQLFEPLANSPLGNMMDLSPFKGGGKFPLRMTDIEAGRRNSSEFAGIDGAALDPALFEVPAGYREQRLEFPGL